MKKLSIRNFVLLFLVSVSITSYSYLNYVAAADREAASSVISTEEEKEITEQSTYFPDIMLAEKILQTVKRLISTSS